MRTDQGRKSLSHEFKELCRDKCIVHQLTISYTLQQNGVVEHKNKTLLEMVRSMMGQINLPISFWGDVLLTVAYILNQMPSKSVSSTPYELWTCRKTNLSHLRCAAFVHDPSYQFGKLGFCGKKVYLYHIPWTLQWMYIRNRVTWCYFSKEWFSTQR